jgi:hypothetical protein
LVLGQNRLRAAQGQRLTFVPVGAERPSLRVGVKGGRRPSEKIEDGKIGHGELSLTHAISLATVTSVNVTERGFGGTEAQTLMAFGAQPVVTKHASKPKQVTDITVRTRDGCEALWIVEQRGADWVQKRLTPALQQSRIPYYADLPPSERDG